MQLMRRTMHIIWPTMKSSVTQPRPAKLQVQAKEEVGK